MSSVLSNLSGSIGGVVGGTKHWVAEQWTQRVVQVSVYSAIVFFVLSSYPLIAFVEKHVWDIFGVKLGKEGTLALHSVIFGLFMYVGTRFILDPMLGKVVEGITNKGSTNGKMAFCRPTQDHIWGKDDPDYEPKGKNSSNSDCDSSLGRWIGCVQQEPPEWECNTNNIKETINGESGDDIAGPAGTPLTPCDPSDENAGCTTGFLCVKDPREGEEEKGYCVRQPQPNEESKVNVA